MAALVGAGSAASTGANAACGAATVATVAAVDATVTTDIYRNELAGTKVSFDLAQITSAGDLLSAVASPRAATLAAVSRIVSHPAWHIVRLRALDAAGNILADVGGPYVIAPVSGVLWLGGRVVGSFVMSVQDDVGVTKLETASSAIRSASTTRASSSPSGARMLIGPAVAGYFSTPSALPGAVIEPLYITDPFEASIADSTNGQIVIARAVATAVEQGLPTRPPSA